MLPFEPSLPLETERLRLRAYTVDDVDGLLAIRSDPDVVRWLLHEPWTREEARRQLESRTEALALDGDGSRIFLAVELRESGVLVGDCMVGLLSAEHRAAEIGYILAPEHQGRGYATELGRELLRVVFDEAGLHRAIARCEPRNEPSWRVMERLGMRREAHFVDNEWIKGEWQSELVYALLDREWPAASAS